MADVSYFVQLYARKDAELAVASRIEAHDTIAAIGEAMRHAQEDATGAIAFARTRAGEIEIILKIGDVPDTLDALTNASR
jgi:hypothetical protein